MKSVSEPGQLWASGLPWGVGRAEQRTSVTGGEEGLLLAAQAPRDSETPTWHSFLLDAPSTALRMPLPSDQSLPWHCSPTPGADLAQLVWAGLGSARGRAWSRGRRFLRGWGGREVSREERWQGDASFYLLGTLTS